MLVPIHRPRTGLSLDMRHATLVRLPPFQLRAFLRRTSCPPVCQSRAVPLPEGLLRLSDAKPNVTAPHRLADLFKELRGGGTRMLPIALSLPNPCARVALLEFDNLPANRPDLDTLLRWRLQQDYHLSPGPLRLVHRVFRREDGDGPGGKPFLVLVTAVREEILSQYVDACAEAGLYPVRIGLASLQVFDLHHPTITRALRAQADDGRGRAWCFVHRADWGFAFFAFAGPVPQLVRFKAWVAAAEDPADGTPAPPMDENTMFAEEVLATLQAYLDTSTRDPETGPIPLFLAGDTAGSPVAAQDAERRVQLERLGVRVTVLDGSDQHEAPSSGDAPLSPPATGRLAALAGVWEA